MVEDTNVSREQRQLKGRNRANKLVFCPDPSANESDDQRILRPGDFVQVRIERATAWSLQGEAVAMEVARH